jgi:hypothetical protein
MMPKDVIKTEADRKAFEALARGAGALVHANKKATRPVRTGGQNNDA